MHDPAWKSQLLRCSVAIVADVVLRELIISGKKCLHTPRLRENIRCVSQMIP